MGSTVVLPDGTTVRVTQEVLEVTSLSRPDPGWGFIDAAGHAHQWYVGDSPAAIAYDPELSYILPTTELVQVAAYCDDDGEEIPVHERRCVLCGARVDPGMTSDDTRQYIRGPRRFYINDKPATQQDAVDALIRATA